MVIVGAFLRSIEELLDVCSSRASLPTVEELRPESCPWCGSVSRSPQGPASIVGHGTYRRQVLGIAAWTMAVVIFVRRYLCRACKKTISILPDFLHPGRWYAGGTILEALRLHLVEGEPEPEIRRKFDVEVYSENWRSLRRWRRELLDRLWPWHAARFGFRGPAKSIREGRKRLLRVFSEALSSNSVQVCRHLLTETVHFKGFAWPRGHDPPEILKRKLLSV